VNDSFTDGTRTDGPDAAAHAIRRGTGRTAAKPRPSPPVRAVQRICDGIGLSMADVALAWLLQQPGVTSVLAGASRPDPVTQSVRAASLRLWAEVCTRLEEATSPVKEILGHNCDPWQSVARIR
jgi:aryl-alcohol dehydrogenase-like predicted oxidoreductase